MSEKDKLRGRGGSVTNRLCNIYVLPAGWNAAACMVRQGWTRRYINLPYLGTATKDVVIQRE